MQLNLLDLIEHGWIIPNPGYGHPLRPEYVIAESQTEIASACLDVWTALIEADLTELIKTKWDLPTLMVLARLGTAARFGEIREELPTISESGLSKSLRSLENQRLVKRLVAPTRPPTPTYQEDGLPHWVGQAVLTLEKCLGSNSH